MQRTGQAEPEPCGAAPNEDQKGRAVRLLADSQLVTRKAGISLCCTVCSEKGRGNHFQNPPFGGEPCAITFCGLQEASVNAIIGSLVRELNR